MTKKIEIEYPDHLPDLLNLSSEEFEKEAKIAMAVKLFELKRISSGMAAKIADIDRSTFLLNLQKYNVNMMNIDPEELDSDVDNAWKI